MLAGFNAFALCRHGLVKDQPIGLSAEPERRSTTVIACRRVVDSCDAAVGAISLESK
jgi:hypothetical protein